MSDETKSALTGERIEEIRQLNAKRTSGPWHWDIPHAGNLLDERVGELHGSAGEEICNFGHSTQYYPSEGDLPNDADRAFIASAPQIIDDLLAENERLSKALDEHQSALHCAGVDHFKLLDQLEQARADVARLRADGERLDWLSESDRIDWFTFGATEEGQYIELYPPGTASHKGRCFTNLRASIDAARTTRATGE